MSKPRRGHRPGSAPKAREAASASAVTPSGETSRWARAGWIVAAFVLFAGMLAFWLSRTTHPPTQSTAAVSAPATAIVGGQVAPARPALVDNQLCVGCHQDAAMKWQQSHHFMAMALPSEASVRGDFANAIFKHQGVTTRFFRRGGKYYVNIDGPDGRLADFEIRYTFGVDPLQQYLIELPGGRLQALTVAWDTTRNRWFHLYPKEKAPAGDVMHWTGNYQTGNTMCIECHTTGYEKRYDAKTGHFDSRWAEMNVSCQSCHGGGAAHVAWAQALPPGGPASAAGAASAPPNHGLSVDLKAAGIEGAAELGARFYAVAFPRDDPKAMSRFSDEVMPSYC